MNFLLTHWHCVLPLAVVVLVSVFLNRDGKKKRGKNPDKRA
jgi:hypothetical protein